MKVRLLLIIFLSSIIIGCNSDETKTIHQSPEVSWKSLLSTDGCLIGAQNDIDGPHEGSCFSNPTWKAFLSNRTEEKLKLLVSRLSSKEPTKIHNCHVDNASEGELAVFALQHLTQKLWIDYSGDNSALLASAASYKKAISDGSYVSDQEFIREILDSESQRDALKDYFCKDQISD
jgi:hypothetical protein